MTNDIYIPHELRATFKGLSRDDKRKVVRAIDSLEEDVLGNSDFVSTGGSAKGDLREARAGSLRVLFHYAAENHSIIITDVSAIIEEPEMALGSPA